MEYCSFCDDKLVYLSQNQIFIQSMLATEFKGIAQTTRHHTAASFCRRAAQRRFDRQVESAFGPQQGGEALEEVVSNSDAVIHFQDSFLKGVDEVMRMDSL